MIAVYILSNTFVPYWTLFGDGIVSSDTTVVACRCFELQPFRASMTLKYLEKMPSALCKFTTAPQ